MQPSHPNWPAPSAPDLRRVTALSQAIDLARAPRLASHMRRRPLPREIDALIRLAAGCRETLAAATAATARDPDFIVAAADLYLRQVVCFPGADPYRTLGVSAHAPRAEIRLHLREFALWLHPDRNGRSADRVLMRRVLEAWELVNDPGTRRRFASMPSRRRRASAYRPSWISRPLPKATPLHSLGYALRHGLRLALVAAGLVVPGLATLSLSGFAEFLIRTQSDPSGIRLPRLARPLQPDEHARGSVAFFDARSGFE